MGSPRFRIEPRDAPAAVAARALGISETRFEECLPQLLSRGFPAADPTTGNYDLKAVSAWQDSRFGLAGGPAASMAKDASAVLSERFAAMRRG